MQYAFGVSRICSIKALISLKSHIISPMWKSARSYSSTLSSSEGKSHFIGFNPSPQSVQGSCTCRISVCSRTPSRRMQAALVSLCIGGIVPSHFLFCLSVPFPEGHPLFFRVGGSLSCAAPQVKGGDEKEKCHVGGHPRFMRRVTPIILYLINFLKLNNAGLHISP